jgi:replication factor C subunit 1
LEFNASDVRSKKALKDELGDITGSYTLQFQHSAKEKRKKRCIIMDEVDGMGAGDRSGMAELIHMIKNSRVPIICICNDRQNQKMKSLLPYCMDLRYRRPVKAVIANRAVEVARREGMAVEQNAAEAIVESCGNDVRQVLNCLQMWASNNGSNMTYRDLKEREHSINKDEILRVSLFDAAKTIMEGRRGLVNSDSAAERTHFFRRNDAYYVDYNFIGLLVQQNYLKVLQPQFNEIKRQNDTSMSVDILDRMHDAAASMSDWALAESGLRGGQNWSLLPLTAALAVKTGSHAGGERGGSLPGFPEFTTFLGRNSTRGKKLRLLSELGHHVRAIIVLAVVVGCVLFLLSQYLFAPRNLTISYR